MLFNPYVHFHIFSQELLKFHNFQQGIRIYKDLYYLNGTKYIKHWLENES